jgi:hypothetical protein
LVNVLSGWCCFRPEVISPWSHPAFDSKSHLCPFLPFGGAPHQCSGIFLALPY